MARSRDLTLADALKQFLQEDKAELLQLFFGWAEEDERLRERILQHSARKMGKGAGVAAAAKAFRKAVKIREFIPYREAGGWADDVDAAIDNFEELLAQGLAAEAAELCEAALAELGETVGMIDDSNGELTDLSDRLQEIHFQACEQAPPDGILLARRLFALEMESEVSAFHNGAVRYRKILGSAGLEEYGRLAELESGADYRVQSIRESVARAIGDVERLAAVLRRDLTQSYHYARVAEAYREAGRHDQALEWAEKGLQAFPKSPDPRLLEIAADEYHLLDRHDTAMQRMWTAFLAHVGLDRYQTLLRHAQIAGEKREWRAKAIAEIRALTGQRDRTLLVDIFLAEQNADAAWEEAQAGGCSSYSWLRLADARNKEHPGDSGPVYFRLADAAVAAVRNSRYEEPVALLVKAGEAMRRAGRGEEFVRGLAQLRNKYKPKRNFLALLDKNRAKLGLG